MKMMTNEQANKVQIINEAEKMMLNNDTIDIFIEVINEAECYDSRLGDYVMYDNEDSFFNDIYPGSKAELVEAILDGSYSRSDEYVCVDYDGSLISWTKSDLMEDYALHFSKIFNLIAEVKGKCTLYDMPGYLVELVDTFNSIEG